MSVIDARQVNRPGDAQAKGWENAPDAPEI